MRRYLIVSLFLLVLINDRPCMASNEIHISGRIENPLRDSISFVLFKDNIQWNKNIIKTCVKDDGSFAASFRLNKNEYCYFTYKDYVADLYLIPGDTLWIQFNAKDFNHSLSFGSGDGKWNDFLFMNRIKFVPQQQSLWKRIATLSADSFCYYRKRIFDDQLKSYEQFISVSSVREEAKNFIKSFLVASYNYDLSQYQIDYAISARKKFDSVPLPENYYAFLNKGNWNDTAILQTAMYTNLVYWYIYVEYLKDRRQRGLSFAQSDSLNISRTFLVAKKCLSGTTLQWYMARFLYDNLNSIDNLEKINDYYYEFIRNCKDSVLLDLIGTKYKNTYTHLTNPQIPDRAKLSTVIDGNGKVLTFKDIISQYKGKVVYIDFWASYCGVCRLEMKNMKELQEQLKNKKVVFLFLSLDKSDVRWKASISELRINGNHFRLSDDLASGLLKEYDISGIPRYMIIRRNGEIYSSNASRPDDEALIPEIEELLK